MSAIRSFETRAFRLVACGAFLLVASGTLFANQVLTLTLKNGAATKTGTVAGDADFFSGTVGNWTIEPITVGGSAGTVSMPNLDLASVDKSNSASPGALTIVFTETGFTATPLILSYSYSASFLGTPSISDTVSLLVNGHVVPGSTAVLSPPIADQGADGTVTIKPGTNYSISLTEVIAATKAAGSEVSSDILVGAETPEPGLYALTGAGLIGLCAFAVRKRKQQATD